MAYSNLTKEYVSVRIAYDPISGVFLWRFRDDMRTPRANNAWNAQFAGRVAGSVSRKNGYIELFGTYAHRIAFLCMTGALPNAQVDHINGDKTDNRWANLRDVPGRINTQNRREARFSRSLPLGVTAPTRLTGGAKPYRSVITTNGRTKHLGYFSDPDSAHAAYVAAKRLLHAGCTL